MEAKLIGYDETPTKDVVLNDTKINDVKAWEPSANDGSSKVHAISSSKVHPISIEPKNLDASSAKPARQAPSLRARPETQQREHNDISSCCADPQTSCNSLGGLSKKSAKSQLHEICAANYWKKPVFECLKETGPSHLRE